MPTASRPRTNRRSWLRRSGISLRAHDSDASRNQSSRRVRGEVGREPPLGRRAPAALLRRLRQEDPALARGRRTTPPHTPARQPADRPRPDRGPPAGHLLGRRTSCRGSRHRQVRPARGLPRRHVRAGERRQRRRLGQRRDRDAEPRPWSRRFLVVLRCAWLALARCIGNANGPVVVDIEGQSTLVFADTLARSIYAYDYDGPAGSVGKRRMFADHSTLGGAPDGATADADGGVWSCVLRSGKLARLTGTGLDRLLDLPMPNPSDVAFGGRRLDRLFVTSIAFDLGDGIAPPPEAGWLLALDDVGAVGRPESRFSLR